MAIQLPDPGNGVPEDETGDNEHVMWLKTRANFSDQSNAASRLVGATTGKVPLADDIVKAMYGGEFVTRIAATTPKYDVNNLSTGTVVVLDGNLDTFLNQPPVSFPVVATVEMYRGSGYQIAYSYFSEKEVWYRSYRNGVFATWVPMSQTKSTYNTTTAAGANVVVDSTGKLMRSTSSERYKNIIADLVLTDDAYANAMSLAPIVYRSTADVDNADWHFYSFSADALGTFDPAFVLWRQTELVTDADGNMTEQQLAEPQAEGLNINAILAFNHAIAIKQDKMIQALTARVNDLAQKLEA